MTETTMTPTTSDRITALKERARLLAEARERASAAEEVRLAACQALAKQLLEAAQPLAGLPVVLHRVASGLVQVHSGDLYDDGKVRVALGLDSLGRGRDALAEVQVAFGPGDTTAPSFWVRCGDGEGPRRLSLDGALAYFVSAVEACFQGEDVPADPEADEIPF